MQNLFFTLPSYAKINWSLRILRRRPDGYHDVRTVLQTISLADELSFEFKHEPEIQLTCDDPGLSVGDDNLIVRAAVLLQEISGTGSGCRIHLRKRIPLGAGLGGGSSNAAITLLGLARLWQLNIELQTLSGMAKKLGADVPFFLNGGTALGTGTGTDISPLPDVHEKHLIIVTPQVAISTAAAYQAVDRLALTSSSSKTILARSPDGPEFDESYLWGLENDFERVIFDMEPGIARARDALLNVGASRVMLAGSGSSVFGIFQDLDAQKRAFGTIEAETGWRIFQCVTIPRSEYSRVINAH